MNHIKGTINWGIIGAGDVCEVKSGPAFNKVPDSRLLAIMRRNASKAADYAKRHHVPKFYTDARLLIGDPEINAIYIATPPAYHINYALAALEAGKPVYIEKPVTLNTEECEIIIQASEKYKIPVSVAHYRRRLPLFLKLREIISTGTIGRVSLVILRMLQSPSQNIIAKTEEFWRVDPAISGGGLFHDLAPHQLDILYWLFGPPKSYQGFSQNQAKRYDAPDVTQLTATFPEDIIFNGIWSFNVHESCNEDRCEIFGDKGKLGFSFFWSPVLEIYSGSGTEKIELPYPTHVQQPLIHDVVRYFHGEIPNPSSLDEALWTMKMMDSTC